MKKTIPVMLVVLDGWGVGQQNSTNAVYVANTPNMDNYTKNYPSTTLTAHDGAVGLPEGQMGNSEVGHLNLGAGRVVHQDYSRINQTIKKGALADNNTLNEIISKTLTNNSALHLMGLISDGGVHSHLDHLCAMLEVAKTRGLDKVFIHCFMDGRDTPPKSGMAYIQSLLANIKSIGCGEIATISGRYYAMDRDNRWERVELAWNAMVDGNAKMFPDPLSAMQAGYDVGETDEFIIPTIISPDGSTPLAVINDNDTILFFNFRADRARQLVHAFYDHDFDNFTREKKPKLAAIATCTRYEKNLELPVLFPPTNLLNILGETISNYGLKQLRIAETEKYAHVTYFFNGGKEKPYELEDRVLLNSPQDVATYDLKPEMSAHDVTKELEKRLQQNKYSFIVVNYANGDMVGHTGDLSAATKACETVDSCLGVIVDRFRELGGIVLVTADHGNAETMYDSDNNSPHTAHTLNPVPFILISDKHQSKILNEGGALKDVAPTILHLMGLKKPSDMEGESLLVD